MTITRVAIIGLGLLGGSIGLAVKARGLAIATTGWLVVAGRAIDLLSTSVAVP